MHFFYAQKKRNPALTHEGFNQNGTNNEVYLRFQIYTIPIKSSIVSEHLFYLRFQVPVEQVGIDVQSNLYAAMPHKHLHRLDVRARPYKVTCERMPEAVVRRFALEPVGKGSFGSLLQPVRSPVHSEEVPFEAYHGQLFFQP